MAVSFKSANKRLMIFAFIASYGTDVLVSYALIKVIGEGDLPGIWAFAIPLGIYLISGIYGLYGAIKFWLWFWLVKEPMIDDMVSVFRALDLPAPNNSYENGDDYLLETALASSPKIAFELGQLKAMTFGRGISASLQKSLILEAAIKRHFQ